MKALLMSSVNATRRAKKKKKMDRSSEDFLDVRIVMIPLEYVRETVYGTNSYKLTLNQIHMKASLLLIYRILKDRISASNISRVSITRDPSDIPLTNWLEANSRTS